MKHPKKMTKLEIALEVSEQRRKMLVELQEENRKLRAQVQARVDQTMLDQRIKLANSLGQMIEATSKAVMYIVAKEVL